MGHLGSKPLWDLHIGSLPTHQPATAPEIRARCESAPPPQENQGWQSYLDLLHHSCFGLWSATRELTVTDPIQDPPGLGTRSSQTNCRQTQRCSGNRFKLQSGRTAELAFEGTQLDLHSSALNAKNPAKQSWLPLSLHLPGPCSNCVLSLPGMRADYISRLGSHTSEVPEPSSHLLTCTYPFPP